MSSTNAKYSTNNNIIYLENFMINVFFFLLTILNNNTNEKSGFFSTTLFKFQNNGIVTHAETIFFCVQQSIQYFIYIYIINKTSIIITNYTNYDQFNTPPPRSWFVIFYFGNQLFCIRVFNYIKIWKSFRN